MGITGKNYNEGVVVSCDSGLALSTGLGADFQQNSESKKKTEVGGNYAGWTRKLVAT